MQFYLILISILHRLPPGKWAPLGQTMECGKKNADLFTGAQWPLLHLLQINVSIISDTALSEYLVLLREGWDTFTRYHPSMQVFHPKFEIHTKTIGASALNLYDDPCQG